MFPVSLCAVQKSRKWAIYLLRRWWSDFLLSKQIKNIGLKCQAMHASENEYSQWLICMKPLLNFSVVEVKSDLMIFGLIVKNWQESVLGSGTGQLQGQRGFWVNPLCRLSAPLFTYTDESKFVTPSLYIWAAALTKEVKAFLLSNAISRSCLSLSPEKIRSVALAWGVWEGECVQ